MNDEYQYLMDLLESGDIEKLDEASLVIEDFPIGKDDFIQRHWITNAIDCGSLESVKWMLKKGVDLSFLDDEGCTPLLSAIDRELPDKYEVLELLIECGAPINKQGWNDWTPLHQAAAREDIRALEILVNNGADLNVKTRIDDYATPLEESRNLNRKKSVAFLENIVQVRTSE
jgi:ankyrin repeat protein